jgi:uncharacterized protein (TIGR01777 family)
MDVVVTGSTGLIGTALFDALAAGGHRPIRMVRGEATGDSIRWDPEAGTIDAASLEGVDAVVHLAGEGIAAKRWSDEQKRKILESRTKSTALLAGTLAGLTRKPSVLVSASAIGYYGERGDDVLSEDEPPARTFLGEVVVAWEAAAAPAAEAGIRVAHPRTGIVLSKDGGALAESLPLFKLGLGGRFGHGRQYWPWITLTDEVRAIEWLLGHDLAGPVNLTAPNPVTNAEFTKALGAALHRPTLFPVPKFGPAAKLGRELAQELLYTSSRVVPTKLLASGFTFAHEHIDDALRAVLAAPR